MWFLGLAEGVTAAPSRVLTEDDSGQISYVAVGATFEIHLRSQLGTGYSWTPESPIESGLTLLGGPSSSAATSPGGWQFQTFTYSAVQSGHYHLVFAYRQPWATTVARRLTFELVVAPK
jgi:predicted secreted protein